MLHFRLERLSCGHALSTRAGVGCGLKRSGQATPLLVRSRPEPACAGPGWRSVRLPEQDTRFVLHGASIRRVRELRGGRSFRNFSSGWRCCLRAQPAASLANLIQRFLSSARSCFQLMPYMREMRSINAGKPSSSGPFIPSSEGAERSRFVRSCQFLTSFNIAV